MLRAWSNRLSPAGERPGLPLWIGHWPTMSAAAAPATEPDNAVLHMDTCMRRLLITAEHDIATRLAALHPAEWFSGSDAYRFLLEVTTGLHSAVPGETNVFGQFRRAWESHRQTGEPGAVQALAPLIARVIRDTRQVRDAHLRNLGGVSWGSLVRRLLSPGTGERVLFVGAGELARSMLPLFRAGEIGVWNRRAARAGVCRRGTAVRPGRGRHCSRLGPPRCHDHAGRPCQRRTLAAAGSPRAWSSRSCTSATDAHDGWAMPRPRAPASISTTCSTCAIPRTISAPCNWSARGWPAVSAPPRLTTLPAPHSAGGQRPDPRRGVPPHCASAPGLRCWPWHRAGSSCAPSGRLIRASMSNW